MVWAFSALLSPMNTMKNTIDDADYIINLAYFIAIFQLVTNFGHSHSIVNRAFSCFIFNGLLFFQFVIPRKIPCSENPSKILKKLPILHRALHAAARSRATTLHSGGSCEAHQKNKRERSCQYIARPAVAVPRLSLRSNRKVVYTINTPYRDGTTQVTFDRGGHPPADFIARLAALA